MTSHYCRCCLFYDTSDSLNLFRFLWMQIRSYQYRMVSLSINYPTCIYFFQQIKNHGRPVQNLMNKALLMSALYSSTQPSLLTRSAVVWSWTCWWKQKSSYHWNVLHCQDLKLLPLMTKAKRSWHESDTAKTSHCIFSRIELDCPTTSDKACWGTSQKSFFFPVILAKMETVAKWMPASPPPPPTPYPMLFRTTRKLLVFITKVNKTTINRGRGGCVFSLFREDGSTAQKLANRWNCFCINSFAEVNVPLFWSSMTELTEWLVKAHQNKIQFRPTDISLLLILFIWSTLSFFSVLSVFVLFCFILFWELRWKNCWADTVKWRKKWPGKCTIVFEKNCVLSYTHR